VVVMPVMTTHYVMLTRPILYTGVTRARRLVVLVGTKRALAIAVRNNRVTDRHSALDVRLVGTHVRASQQLCSAPQ
jgi:exodeoxyribonuclease V alpha subunit